MTAMPQYIDNLTLSLTQEIHVRAPLGTTFASLGVGKGWASLFERICKDAEAPLSRTASR
jgi:hypothetical protein